MPDRANHAAGERIADKYVLVRPLDQGGMGAVWAARNEVLDAHVALKILHADLTETTAADRLLSEAKLLARLQHPGIVRVLDFGCTDAGEPFVAMELLDGESLADTIDRRGRLSATEAVSLLLPVIDAVRAAHEAGIVHRDLKPENVFLAAVAGRIQPKVLDFGIALSQSMSLRRTDQGAVLGSPAYMSPEQARGVAVDARTDIWSLAVLLQELVTGSMPFQRDNYHATLRAIIEETPPSITSLGAGDDLLAAVLERALAKLPEQRFPTVRDFGVALAQWLFSQGVDEDASNVSLRSSWLRVSEAPTSLAPMTLTSSEPPSMRDTLAPPAPAERKEETTGTVLRRSVPGVSITSQGTSPRRRARLLAALAAVVALVVLGLLVWPVSTARQVTESGSALEPASAAPPPVVEAKVADEPVVAPPAKQEETDAGAKAPAAPPARPSEARPRAREHRERHRPFRPRGI